MSLTSHTPRAALLALCAILLAALFAAPADAKRKHQRAGKPATSYQSTVKVCPGAREVPSAATVSGAQAATLCLVNNERLTRGLRALRANARLTQAARDHSADMVTNHYFAHRSPSGRTLISRITRRGYLSDARGWTAGENIAWGSGALATPDAIVRAWMDSPGHRQNILRPDFKEVGTGVSAGAPVPGLDGQGATYTQAFGTRG